MSIKPFYVLEVIEQIPGPMHERVTWDEAVDLATKLVMEQSPEGDEAFDEAEVRKELDEDGDWREGQTLADYMVFILQTEDE